MAIALRRPGSGRWQTGRQWVPVDSQYYQAEQAEEGTARPAARRDVEGRWRQGVSGNPVGRPRGSRNRATIMAESCSMPQPQAWSARPIERGLGGDLVDL